MDNLGSRTLAFLDTETTGLSAWFGDRICEIAILRCQGEEIIDSFDTLVNPARPISPGAARVNGLTDAELAGASFRRNCRPGNARLEGPSSSATTPPSTWASSAASWPASANSFHRSR
jgi:DNA polymerase III epsilon subunit-like protein